MGVLSRRLEAALTVPPRLVPAGADPPAGLGGEGVERRPPELSPARPADRERRAAGPGRLPALLGGEIAGELAGPDQRGRARPGRREPAATTCLIRSPAIRTEPSRSIDRRAGDEPRRRCPSSAAQQDDQLGPARPEYRASRGCRSPASPRSPRERGDDADERASRASAPRSGLAAIATPAPSAAAISAPRDDVMWAASRTGTKRRAASPRRGRRRGLGREPDEQRDGHRGHRAERVPVADRVAEPAARGGERRDERRVAAAESEQPRGDRDRRDRRQARQRLPPRTDATGTRAQQQPGEDEDAQVRREPDDVGEPGARVRRPAEREGGEDRKRRRAPWRRRGTGVGSVTLRSAEQSDEHDRRPRAAAGRAQGRRRRNRRRRAQSRRSRRRRRRPSGTSGIQRRPAIPDVAFTIF